MPKQNIPILGMHCKSCEILIEDKLLKINGVTKVNISHKTAAAEIFYDNTKPAMQDIENAITAAGYKIGTDKQPKTWLSKNIKDYQQFVIALIIVFVLWLYLKLLGVANFNFVSANNPTSFSVVLLIGLTAGFSTCMALVGGLILGVSARHAAKHPEATVIQKFRPHLFFNLGRIFSYTFFGGILGLIGSAFHLSSILLGILTIIIGGVMLIMGVKLIGLFPKLESVNISLPSKINKILGIKKHEKEYGVKNAMIIGALTFFLPCGFTQAMQLYAVSTGNFIQGSLIMGLFAIGTLPGLLSVGGIAALVKGKFALYFFKVAGIVVILFAVFNITNGFNLAGWQVKINNVQKTQDNKEDVILENGVQIVKMIQGNRGYSPNSFTIKKGVPVKWIIDSQAANSCASSIIMSKYNISKNLVAGENIIEFTPTVTGSINFSCSMGMYTGKFNVIE